MARILVIGDDAEACSAVGEGLGETGFEAEAAGDGVAGLERAGTDGFDLVIIDVSPPGSGGWAILARIRGVDTLTPVLMLSPLDGVEHKVRGLLMGADDYLTKPFSFEELVARIRAICRRLPQPSARESDLDDLRLDEPNAIAYRGAAEIPLTPKECELLKLFVSRRGEVLSSELIASRVWDRRMSSESNVVAVSIRRLRRKLDDPFARKLIRTMHGRGYVML